MQRNRTKYSITGVTAVLLLLAGVAVFFGFSSNLFGGSFPWMLIAIVGGIIVVLSLGISVAFLRRKPSDTYDISLNENFKPFEESLQGREEDDFIPSEKLSSKLNYETKYCEFCGSVIETGTKFCVSCGRKFD